MALLDSQLRHHWNISIALDGMIEGRLFAFVYSMISETGNGRLLYHSFSVIDDAAVFEIDVETR